MRHPIQLDRRAVASCFTRCEREQLSQAATPHERAQLMAAMWGLKESVVKALGGRPSGLEWCDIQTADRRTDDIPPPAVVGFGALLGRCSGQQPVYTSICLPPLSRRAQTSVRARSFSGAGWGAWVSDSSQVIAGVVLDCRELRLSQASGHQAQKECA